MHRIIRHLALYPLAKQAATILILLTTVPSIGYARQPALHVIGVYEPYNFEGRRADPPSVKITLHGSHPIVLALMNFDAVTWDITADKDVVVKEIILTGVKRAKIKGSKKIKGVKKRTVRVTRKKFPLGSLRVDEKGMMEQTAPLLKQYTGLDISTYQTSLRSTEFSVGPSTVRSRSRSKQPVLHAIGVNEGPVHFGGPIQDPSRSTIKIRVHRTSHPIILALFNYDAVMWDIKADKGAIIREIILSNTHGAKVKGIDVRTVMVTRKLYDIAIDNEHMVHIAPLLKQYTGLDISTFQSSYSGTEFSVGP